jgi:hypothetical protein
VDRRTHVVAETRERELGGAGPAADRVARLDEEDGASCLRESECGGEAVGPGADDDRV